VTALASSWIGDDSATGRCEEGDTSGWVNKPPWNSSVTQTPTAQMQSLDHSCCLLEAPGEKMRARGCMQVERTILALHQQFAHLLLHKIELPLDYQPFQRIQWRAEK